MISGTLHSLPLERRWVWGTECVFEGEKNGIKFVHVHLQTSVFVKLVEMILEYVTDDFDAVEYYGGVVSVKGIEDSVDVGVEMFLM